MRIITLLVSLLALQGAAFSQDTLTELSDKPPRVQVVTNKGDFVIELDRNRAPLTVAHFLENVSSGFYAGTIFHRVVSGFIAQGGGYTTDMQLKPTEGTVFNESGNGLSNLRGTIGYARSNEPHSGTTQFYINLADNLDLNPRPTRWGYAVFGKVVEGMEVVDEIGHVPTAGGGDFDRNVPVDPIIIERMVLLTE
jgi:peptidyl-prolyl cis-trans isomerase A (cyclophilin A)